MASCWLRCKLVLFFSLVHTSQKFVSTSYMGIHVMLDLFCFPVSHQLRCTVKLNIHVLVILSFQNRDFCQCRPLNNNNVILSDPPLPWWEGGGRSQWIWILFIHIARKVTPRPPPSPCHILQENHLQKYCTFSVWRKVASWKVAL